MSKVASHIHNPAKLGKNIAWNSVGILIPIIIAVVSIPVLIANIGAPRYGALTIIWITISYLTLFDFGLGQAVARRVSEQIGMTRQSTIRVTLASGAVLALVFGITAGFILYCVRYVLSGLMVHNAPEISKSLATSFGMLSVAMPFTVGGAALVGALQGFQEFTTISYVRMLNGIWMFAVPATLSFWFPLLPWMVGSIIVGRIIAYAIYYIAVHNRCKFSLTEFRHYEASKFLKIGAWLTISKVISPVMDYFDRMVLAYAVGLLAVAYYSTSFEVVFRLLMFPMALGQVIMPALSSMGERFEAKRLIVAADDTLLIGTGTVAAVLIIAAKPLLGAWLNPEFALHGASVLQILAIALVFNGLAQIPFNHLLARGRIDLVAKLHMLEVPVYCGLLVLAVRTWGIDGAAATWVLRSGVDMSALYLLSGKVRSDTRWHSIRMIGKSIIVVAFLVSIVFWPFGQWLSMFSIVSISSVFIAWHASRLRTLIAPVSENSSL